MTASQPAAQATVQPAAHLPKPQNETILLRTDKDPALRAAWARLLQYERASVENRRVFNTIRQWVIFSGYAIVLLSVTWVFVVLSTSPLAVFAQPLIIVLGFIFIGLIVFQSYAAANVKSVTYRIVAERIRREIYMYRMQTRQYLGTPQEQQQRLLEHIRSADDWVSDVRVPTVSQFNLYDEDKIPTMVKQHTGKGLGIDSADDGFRALPIEEYIRARVKPRISFYVRQAEKEDTLRRLYLWMIGIALGATPLVATINTGNFLVLPALTVATAVALNLYVEFRQYGRNVSTYRATADRAVAEMHNWNLTPEWHDDPDAIGQFVHRIESIWKTESDLYLLQSLVVAGVTDYDLISGFLQADTQTELEKDTEASYLTKNSIFISYRRADSQEVVGRVYDRLKARFGKDAVFKDVDSIPFGLDFRTYVQSVLKNCAVVLVVIGDKWVTVTNPDGTRRLDDPDDVVRLEVAIGLERGIPVIPVLVKGARMPQEGELPADLSQLAYYNGSQVRNDPDFEGDIERLIKSLEEALIRKILR
jgi:hypothetical protein